MRLILVPVADRPECMQALTTAFDLAGRFQADVSGCHIRPHRESRVRMPAVLAGAEAEWAVATKGWNADKLGRDARVLFEKTAAAAGYPVASRPGTAEEPAALWFERVGSPDRIIPIVGPTADLLVVSRPAARGGNLASLFLMTALLKSCRPVLVLPQRRLKAPGQHVLIAWNQSAEASHAVAAGMSMIKAADSVTICTVGTETAPGPKATHLARYLQHHGVDAGIVRRQGRDVPAELEAAGNEVGADLLMMGAYSRHRLRELVFGGTTEHMLRRARLPVLMFHA